VGAGERSACPTWMLVCICASRSLSSFGSEARYDPCDATLPDADDDDAAAVAVLVLWVVAVFLVRWGRCVGVAPAAPVAWRVFVRTCADRHDTAGGERDPAHVSEAIVRGAPARNGRPARQSPAAKETAVIGARQIR